MGALPSAQRRLLIMEELDRAGHAMVGDLAERHRVSEMTIRRDLDALDRRGDVVRIHGGVIARHRLASFELPWDQKLSLQSEAKLRIGKAAADRVKPGETILIDSGTTALAVARALSVPCSVVVVDIKIAAELASRPAAEGIETMITGGSVRSGYFSTTGPFPLEMLDRLHVDRAFLGADAVDIAAGITNSTVDEMAVKQKMIKAAKEVVLIADGSKYGIVALAQVASLADVDLWVTDSSLDTADLESVRSIGLKVEVV